jgi:ribosomal protein L40E
MSSETSTEPQVGGTVADADSLQPWQLFTLAGLIGATLTVFMSRGQSPSAVILLSLTIFAAAWVGVAALRTFMPLAGKISPHHAQILGGRTRAALEREKTLVLRSIKDLEFDRAMGKLSEKDFAEMGARLRARAAGLMRQLDAGAGYREQIEKEIERRIGKADVVRASSSKSETSGDSKISARAAGSTEQDPAYAVCVQCSGTNDSDARFCKHCGAKVGAQS